MIGTNLVFSGIRGFPSGAYYVLTATNLALPLAQWRRIATNYFDAAGNYSVTNSIAIVIDHQFYRLQQN